MVKTMSKKIQKRFISIVDYDHCAEHCTETIDEPSMTVAGESYTIQELMARHQNMNDPGVDHEVYWEDTDDFDMPDIGKLRKLDIFEQHELLAQVQEKAKAAQLKIEAYQRDLNKGVAEARAKGEKSVEAKERSVESGESANSTAAEAPAPVNP
jgi:hypothetical protein